MAEKNNNIINIIYKKRNIKKNNKKRNYLNLKILNINFILFKKYQNPLKDYNIFKLKFLNKYNKLL